MKKAFALLSLGAILEYYDFAIFIYFAKSIGESLIPVYDTTANLIASFAIFAVGALLRPIGGIIFSHFGDKYGRKNIFVYTVFLMAIPTFLIALIPAYSKIGIYATILLVFLRCLQGLAIGGEIPGSVVFAYELSTKKYKALNTNIVIAGTNIGFFLASLLGAVLLNHYHFDFAVWRIPFILGGIFGIISFYLRKNLLETPEYLEYKQFIEQQKVVPLKALFKKHKIALMRMVAFGCLLASSLAVFTFFMPSYLSTYYRFPLSEVLKYNSYSIIIFIMASFIAGKYHYFFGKKFLLISTILFVFACFYLFFNYANLKLTQIVYYHYLALSFIGIICGRMPVLSASFFPVHVRYSGVALSYNISFGIVAGLTQVVLFSLIKISGIMWVPAIYITLFAIVALVFIATTPSRKFVEYH